MTLRKFERVSTDDSTLNRIQERVEDAFLPVTSSSILDGKIINNVELASGTTSIISHNLGRAIKGYIVISKMQLSMFMTPSLQTVIKIDFYI